MKPAFLILWIGFFMALAGSTPWTIAADAEKPVNPSIAVIDLSGKVTEKGHCELKCEYDVGKDGKPVRLDAFCAVRYSEDGATNSFDLKPEPKSPAGGEPGHFAFNWTDSEVQEGKTYYYYLTYTADVRLATSPIVLTVPEKGSEKGNGVENAAFAVEVFGPEQMGVPNVFIARAHANKPGATFSWRPVDPRVGSVCAELRDNALLRVKDVPGFGHCAWIVVARLGNETAQALYMPGMIKLSWIPVATPSVEEIEDAKNGTEAGKKILRDRLRSTFRADNNDAMSRHVTTHFFLKVGMPALPEVQAYYEENHDAGVRYELLELMASIDPRFAFDQYFDRVLKERDLPQSAYLVKLADKLAKDDPESILKKLKPLLADSMPSLRYSAIGALGKIGSEKVVPDLKQVRDSDPLGTLRFAAARALVAIRTKTYPPGPKPSNWRPRAPVSDDVEAARTLLPEVLKQANEPGATNETLLAKDSPLAKFCILCDATVPVITNWLYQGTFTDEEMERIKWAFELTGAELPPDINDTFVERVLSKEGQAQQDELKHYRSFLQNWTEYDWGRMNAILDDENPKDLSIGHRLEILAWTGQSVKTEMERAGGDIWLGRATRWQDHWFQFTQLGYTPDRKYLVGRCTDGSIRVWNAETFEDCWTGHLVNVRDFVQNDNKRYLWARIQDTDGKSNIRLWRLSDGQVFNRPEGDLSADGCWFAYGEGRIVHLVDPETGEEKKSLTLDGAAGSIQFSTSGKYVYASEYEGNTYRWKLDDFSQQVLPSNLHLWPLANDSQYAARDSVDGLEVLNVNTNKMLFTVKLTSEIHYNQVAPDGSSITVVEDGGPVRQFELPSGKLSWEAGSYSSYGPSYTDDGRWIILRSQSRTFILDARTGKPQFQQGSIDKYDGPSIFRLKGGEFLVIEDKNPAVKLLDPQTLKAIGEFKKIVAFDWSGNCFDVDQVRGRLAYTSGGNLTICDARTGEAIRQLPQKPKFSRHPSSYNSIEQPLETLLRLQEVDDQVGKLARDMFPETKDLLKDRPQRPKPRVEPSTSKMDEGF